MHRPDPKPLAFFSFIPRGIAIAATVRSEAGRARGPCRQSRTGPSRGNCIACSGPQALVGRYTRAWHELLGDSTDHGLGHDASALTAQMPGRRWRQEESGQSRLLLFSSLASQHARLQTVSTVRGEELASGWLRKCLKLVAGERYIANPTILEALFSYRRAA